MIEAELWAVYGGLTIVLQRGSTQDHIESDSKNAIELIKKGGTQNFPRRALLEDTRFLFQRGGHEMQRIIREGNNFTDTLAKLGTDQSVRLVELEDPPAAITGMLMADLIAIGSLWM